MSGITVSNLCKTYIVNKRQNNVLRNVNLTLEEKEMIAVMGPSGYGKTTLLYTISGMDSATAGSVKFFERELTDMSRNEERSREEKKSMPMPQSSCRSLASVKLRITM